jgi:riboflavin biosynthesis pyrimidine reductase
MSLDRPFVTLNVAVTADGKTDTIDRHGAMISSPEDLARVDRLRAESDAIMVGGHTLLGDDPRLTVKSLNMTGRIPHIIPSNPYNRFYLETKAAKSGHLIDFAGKEHLPEQSDRPAFEGMSEEQVAALQDL